MSPTRRGRPRGSRETTNKKATSERKPRVKRTEKLFMRLFPWEKEAIEWLAGEAPFISMLRACAVQKSTAARFRWFEKEQLIQRWADRRDEAAKKEQNTAALAARYMIDAIRQQQRNELELVRRDLTANPALPLLSREGAIERLQEEESMFRREVMERHPEVRSEIALPEWNVEPSYEELSEELRRLVDLRITAAKASRRSTKRRNS